MFVTCYVPGKLHFSRYVAWYTKYSVTGNRKAVYIYLHFIPPLSPPPPLWKGLEGLYPMCDLAFGVQHCHVKFTGAGLLREIAMSQKKWINRNTNITSLALGNNRPHDRLLKKKWICL